MCVYNIHKVLFVSNSRPLSKIIIIYGEKVVRCSSQLSDMTSLAKLRDRMFTVCPDTHHGNRHATQHVFSLQNIANNQIST